MKQTFDLIIAGGGGAGLFCAWQAASKGVKTLLLEANSVPGKKILVSGGGRCNFTNLGASEQNYVSKNPKFPISALRSYRPQEFLDLVLAHKIPVFEKTPGQLFCLKSAKDIVKMLLDLCDRSGVEIACSTPLKNIEIKDGGFIVNSRLSSKKLVIATGGLSWPRLGANDTGYRMARKLGHEILPLDPALVGLALAKDQEDLFSSLSGIALPVCIEQGKLKFKENMLFTHTGISGPAILQISLHIKPPLNLRVDLLPDCLHESMLQPALEQLPKRLTQVLRGIIQGRAPNQALRMLKEFEFVISKTEGYTKAEVTRGGVDTKDLWPSSLESRLIKGLYFIGEVVDVTGWLGGYNFQWAWASAFAASRSIVSELKA